MSTEEFLSKLLSDKHADVLREGVAWLVGELMESEIAVQAGAALGSSLWPSGAFCAAGGW